MVWHLLYIMEMQVSFKTEQPGRGIMTTRTLLKYSMIIAIIIAGICQVQASTYNLGTLNGSVGAGSYGSLDIPGTHYDYWSLQLSGLDSTNAITVVNGDEIQATVQLDQSFTIPLSGYLTWFDLTLRGSNFSGVDTEVENVLTEFFNAGSSVAYFVGQSTTTNSRLVNAVTFAPQTITFDSVTVDFMITTLDQPATLDGAQIDYWLFTQTPVPEPSFMLLIGLGLGAVSLVGRRFKA
jgi:hypothetical protein